MRSRRFWLRAALALPTLALPALTVRAGGITGGALEITQLANNAELMAQVAESAQQTVQQINMLATMLQNLKSLSNLAGIAQQLGLPLDSLQSFVQSYKTTQGALSRLNEMQTTLTRLGKNADGMASFYSTLIDDLEKYAGGSKTLTRQQLNSIFLTADRASMDRQRRVVAQRYEQTRAIQDDMKFVQDNAREIASITGNVQGLQFLASQQAGIQRMLLDSQLAFQQWATEMSAERLEQMERERLERERARLMLKDSLERAAF